MSQYELMQWLGLGAGAIVFALIVRAIVRFVRALGRIWPDTAAKHGLTFVEEKDAKDGRSIERQVLTGPSLSVVSSREQYFNQRTTSTRVVAKAPRLTASCVFDLSRQRPEATLHLVTTGDAKFDALRFVTTEFKEPARALLTEPVRAALLSCPLHGLRVSCRPGEVTVSFGQLVTGIEEVEGAIQVALAIAKG